MDFTLVAFYGGGPLETSAAKARRRAKSARRASGLNLLCAAIIFRNNDNYDSFLSTFVDENRRSIVSGDPVGLRCACSRSGNIQS